MIVNWKEKKKKLKTQPKRQKDRWRGKLTGSKLRYKSLNARRKNCRQSWLRPNARVLNRLKASESFR